MSRQSVRLRHIASLNTACSSSEARSYVALEDVESWRGQLLAEADIEVREPGGGNGIASVDVGDVLFGKLRPYLAKSWVADRPTYASTELLCMRPADGVDSRWLGYVARSLPFVQWAVATSEGTKMPRTSWEKMGGYRLSLPRPAEQRAIVEFLDTETARIDGLIAKKQRLLDVLGEVRWLVFEGALSRRSVALPDSVDPVSMRETPLPPGWTTPKLSSVLVQLTNGYVGPTRDILRDQGVRYIQGLHIKKGTINFDRRPYYVEEAWHEAHPRTALRSGDVLIVQTGDIGQVAVVPDDFGVANCHALLIARANPDIISGPYLGAYLQSRFGYHSLLRVATGALHPHLEFGIRDVPVLVPPRPLQDELVREISGHRLHIDRLMTMLARQVDLLAERRQALITAAVTGELDVSRPIAEEVQCPRPSIS